MRRDSHSPALTSVLHRHVACTCGQGTLPLEVLEMLPIEKLTLPHIRTEWGSTVNLGPAAAVQPTDIT